MSPRPVAHDPSVRDYADTSPASLGRGKRKVSAHEWRAPGDEHDASGSRLSDFNRRSG